MHTIRLRQPWRAEALADGSVRFTRRFHRPTGLEPSSRVWLVIEGVAETMRVAVNGREFGRIVPPTTMQAASDACTSRTRLDITADLRASNLISITISAPAATAQPPSQVRLEID